MQCSACRHGLKNHQDIEVVPFNDERGVLEASLTAVFAKEFAYRCLCSRRAPAIQVLSSNTPAGHQVRCELLGRGCAGYAGSRAEGSQSVSRKKSQYRDVPSLLCTERTRGRRSRTAQT